MKKGKNICKEENKEELNKEKIAGGLTKEEIEETYSTAFVYYLIETITMLLENLIEICQELIQEKKLCNKEFEIIGFKTDEEKKGTELFVEYEQLVNYLYSVTTNEMFEAAEHKNVTSLKLENVEKSFKKFKEKVKEIQKNSEIDTSEKYEKYFEVLKAIKLKWEQVFAVIDYIIKSAKAFINRQEKQ